MKKFYKILFFNSMVLGTLISISSYSWFSMWIGLEINLLSIIPLFKNTKNKYPAEASIKYFITQVLASTIILFSIMISLIMNENIEINSWLMMIMNSALLTKLGMAPFHSWLPEVADGLGWLNNLILLTWQKLTPMILIMYNLNMNLFLSSIIVLSAILSGIMGLNQISLRKILAYSSINHMAWMLSSMLILKMIWIIYFIVYTIISMNIILMFLNMNIFYTPQLLTSLSSMKMLKLIFVLNFMSLGGLPPFLGFLPKWLTINYLTPNFYFLSIVLILSSLITLFYYLRICLTTFMLSGQESIMFSAEKNYSTLISFNLISLSGLIFCTNMFNFL